MDEVRPPAGSELAAEKCVSLAPGVRRIVAGNAGMMTGPGTNTYLFGVREVAVLDPGPDDARHLDAILAAAGAATIDALTALVYDDVAVERHRWARLTLEAHLIKLARERRAGERDGVWRLNPS